MTSKSSHSARTGSVYKNRWYDLKVPPVESFHADSLVSVIIPYYDRPQELALTLTALAHQTYPRELLEVIVADDGSTVGPSLESIADKLNLRLVRQERSGYGAGRARNLGAAAAHGEILVFLDCDMIPVRQHISMHARWHTGADSAVVVGFRYHAEFDRISSDQLASALSEDRIQDLVDPRGISRPEWIEHHMTRTDELTEDRDDYFLLTSSGNISMPRDLFHDVGGFDESFTQWGGEDNELGFRLFQAGAVIVPERAAICWHQGEGAAPSASERQSLWEQRPKMRNLIAELGYRKPQPGCSYTVPYAVLDVDTRLSTVEDAMETIISILGSDFHDLLIHVISTPGTPQDLWLRRRFEDDCRVHVSQEDASIPNTRFSPLRVSVPVGILFHRTTLTRIATTVRASGVGLLQLTWPNGDGDLEPVVARLTRAINRASRTTNDPLDLDRAIGESFDVRWVSGRSFGLGRTASSGIAVPPTDPDKKPMNDVKRLSAAVDSLKTRLSSAEQRVAKLRSRRVVRVADAVGALVRNHSIADMRRALRR